MAGKKLAWNTIPVYKTSLNVILELSFFTTPISTSPHISKWRVFEILCCNAPWDLFREERVGLTLFSRRQGQTVDGVWMKLITMIKSWVCNFENSVQSQKRLSVKALDLFPFRPPQPESYGSHCRPRCMRISRDLTSVLRLDLDK